MVEEWIGKIHTGDCLELLPKLPQKSIGLIVTSPPYNLLEGSGGMSKSSAKSSKWKTAALRDGYEDYGDNMPYSKYIEWQRACLSAMIRVLRDDGAIFYNHKWRVQKGLLQDRSEIIKGFPVRQIIIWQRAGGINFNDRFFLPTYEVIYLICKENFKLAKKSSGVGDVWKIPQEKKNPHPAPFPLELAKRCVISTDAEIVLDPFMGSGTVLMAAEKYGRKWIGMDIVPKYVEKAKKRLQAYRDSGYNKDSIYE